MSYVGLTHFAAGLLRPRRRDLSHGPHSASSAAIAVPRLDLDHGDRDVDLSARPFDNVLLEPSRALARMGDDDHLVGREQAQCVLQCEDRVSFANVTRGIDSALVERRDRGFETASGILDLVVHVARGEVERRLHERRRHDPDLCRPSLGMTDDLTHQRLVADHLVREDHDPMCIVSRAGRASGAVSRTCGHPVLRTLGSAGETCPRNVPEAS